MSGSDSSNRTTTGPLAGLRIFDMTQVAAGPWVSVLLGGLGATVFRIEPPGEKWSGDMSARILPTMNGIGTTWLTCNMFKQSVALNFKNEDDARLGLQLVASCDLFVENMRKGVADRLGFGYERLSEINPGICYISINGYGQVGPLADEGATDPLIQAFSGWGSVNGARGSGGEMHRSYAHLDLTSGTYATLAAMLLLNRKRRTGIGGRLNIPMFRAALTNQTTRVAEYFATGQHPMPQGSRASRFAPDEAFRCQDGRFIAVSVESEDLWPKFCSAIGKDDIASRYPTNASRLAQRDQLAEELTAVFATKPLRWWHLRLSHAGVPSGPFLSFDELLNHPQVNANGYIATNETPFGPLRSGAAPITVDGRSAPAMWATSPGADTESVLSSLKQDSLSAGAHGG